MKSVLITGCSCGIGLCVAQGLKKAGYQVFASARQEYRRSKRRYKLNNTIRKRSIMTDDEKDYKKVMDTKYKIYCKKKFR